jgi:hypothetical protein
MTGSSGGALEVSGDLGPSGLFAVAGAGPVEVRVGGIELAASAGERTFRVPPFAVPGTAIEVRAGGISRGLAVADPGPVTWVFPLAGQSNMVSRADADGSAPWPAAVRFVTQEGQPIPPAPMIGTAANDAGPFLIAKRFAADFLAGRPRDGIVFVPGAVGGTSFWNERWNPGEDLYENLVALTRRVLAGNPDWRLRAMLFQGFETDAKNGMAAETFRVALDRFVRRVRADLQAAELPIVFGELPPGFVDGYRERVAIRDEVRAAAERLPFTAVASSRSPSVCDDDGLHYSTAGLLAIGDRYAGALAAAEANSPVAAPV